MRDTGGMYIAMDDMTNTPDIVWENVVLPFQLDRSNIRGRVARLDTTLQHILLRHDYPPAVQAMIVEATLLTALIGQTIKPRWKLSLQVRGNGPIRLIATDFYAPDEKTDAAHIRAYAGFTGDHLDPNADPFSQLGKGYFAILIDQGAGTVPYQGITPLAGGALKTCAEVYFAQSEQLPTRFALSYGHSQTPGETLNWRAGGIVLQHMPNAASKLSEGGTGEGGLLMVTDLMDDDEAENWARVNVLLDTVDDIELIGPHITPPEMLRRLFHQENPRVYDTQNVQFGCACSAERVRESLSIYSARDIAHMITDKGVVTADCQFCGAHYEFDPKTLGRDAGPRDADGPHA